MFEVGDSVVCINIDKDLHNIPITLGKVYIITKIKDDMCYVNNDRNFISRHCLFRFILLDEHRRMKILKLKERINGSR